ncbi:MAG: ArnT family glycosyltransferase [Acidimicrobiales bacterium]
MTETVPTGRAEARIGRFERRLAAIAALSFVGKLVYLFAEKRRDVDLLDEGDALYYFLQARLNSLGDWYIDPATGGPGADHPPLTSLVLTPTAWLTDSSIFAMRLTMTVIGVAVVIGIGLLGRRIGGERVGLVAAVIGAAYAALWVNDALLMSETLAALGTVAVLLAGYRLGDRRDVGSAVLFGLAGGLATLARAELVLLLPLVGLVVVLSGWSDRDGDHGGSVRLLVIGAVASVAVVSPWIGWNLARFEEPTLISTNDGLTLVGANCPATYESPSALGFWVLQCGLDVPVEGDRSSASATWRAEAFDYIGDNLDRVPTVVAARLGRTFGVYEPKQMVYFNGFEGRETWSSWLAFGQYWTLVPFALAGAVIGIRRQLFLAPLAAPVVVVVVVTVVFYGLARFRVPADVVLVVLAAIAVDAVLRRRDRSGDRCDAADIGTPTTAGS